jgi:uncharacterized protein YoxC
MPFATTTMRSMEKKITLETIAVNIADLASLINAQGIKIEAQSAILNNHTRAIKDIKQKVDRIDLTTHAIQEDVEGVHEEMKGIHKVLDKFDTRIVRLEIHAGFPMETAEEEPSIT